MNHLPGVVEGDGVAVLGQHLPIDGDVPSVADRTAWSPRKRLRASPAVRAWSRSSFRGATARLRGVQRPGIQADVPTDASSWHLVRAWTFRSSIGRLVTPRGPAAPSESAVVKTAV